jgi:hypothetical protein
LIAMMFRLSAAGTPAWKLALIPVLMAVLFKVTRTSAPEADPVIEAGQQTSTAEPAPPPARKPLVLPELTLNDALKFDPFAPLPQAERAPEEPAAVLEPQEAPDALPPVAPPPAAPSGPIVNPLAEKAATLKQLTVSAVFPSPKGSMAIIDSKTVRAGDWLSPGVRVVEIRGTDVILRVENGEAAPGASSGESVSR